MFTLALAVFFFFETAIAGIKSASVYVENDSAGGKRSGILKPGIGGKSLALQGGSKRLRIPLAPYKFRNQTRNPVLNPSRDPFTRGGVSKSDSTGTRTYFRAGTSVVSPVLDDGSATYTPGISERRNNNSTYYHSDLKNTTAQTASNETVSGTNQYDAFGNLLNYTGDWNGPFAYGGAFGYQTDDDSGLMLLGHRYYDSSTGRFISRDPIGDGSNWYVYCEQSPLNFFDNSRIITSKKS